MLNIPQSSSGEIKKLMDKALTNKKRERITKAIKSKKVVDMLMKGEYLPVQMLLDDYLQITTGMPVDNIKKSILLSIIFKTEGYENIRKHLSNISVLKTEKNLEILIELFEEFELTEPLKKAQTDLNKLTTKRR